MHQRCGKLGNQAKSLIQVARKKIEHGWWKCCPAQSKPQLMVDYTGINHCPLAEHAPSLRTSSPFTYSHCSPINLPDQKLPSFLSFEEERERVCA